ncbi:MAG: nucleoside triphosphate pyrophosphatase [Anaerolineales bacterium]
MRPLILASGSPRRRELLALSGLAYAVRPAAAVEVPQAGEAPADFARRMSTTKARAAAKEAEPGALVIGADTIVVLDGEIIGKPSGPAHAVELLRRLRGRPHQVLTAITVMDTAADPPLELTDLVTTPVPMRGYSDEEIEAYVATGNPLDKAGAYAIQYAAFQPVAMERFAGCLANVMGLPLCRLLGLLAQRGLASATPAAQPLGDCQHFDSDACPFIREINLERAL